MTRWELQAVSPLEPVGEPPLRWGGARTVRGLETSLRHPVSGSDMNESFPVRHGTDLPVALPRSTTDAISDPTPGSWRTTANPR